VIRGITRRFQIRFQRKWGQNFLADRKSLDRLIEALQTYEAAQAPPQLRAAIRAYGGFAEAASVEWLERGRLTREQARVLLVQGFLSIVRDVLPTVEQATAATDGSV